MGWRGIQHSRSLKNQPNSAEVKQFRFSDTHLELSNKDTGSRERGHNSLPTTIFCCQQVCSISDKAYVGCSIKFYPSKIFVIDWFFNPTWWNFIFSLTCVLIGIKWKVEKGCIWACLWSISLAKLKFCSFQNSVFFVCDSSCPFPRQCLSIQTSPFYGL